MVDCMIVDDSKDSISCFIDFVEMVMYEGDGNCFFCFYFVDGSM